MKRRSAAQWKALSPAYRARLERRGITRGDYLKGVPLSDARGHAATPEKPARAAKNPERFAGYTKRQKVRGKRIKVASTTGVVAVAKMTKRDRSTVGSHWNALGKSLDPFRRDPDVLTKFRGRKVRGVDPSTGEPVTLELETNEFQLMRLAQAGELDIEDIYWDEWLETAA